MVEKLQALPELRDVASDQQIGGLRAKLVFDRDTASRLGITPTMIDNTLYDAYGQRQVSTMFTQLNQYHVVLEVKPGFHERSRWICATCSSVPPREGPAGSSGVVSGGSTTTAGFRTVQRVGGGGDGRADDRRVDGRGAVTSQSRRPAPSSRYFSPTGIRCR